jgi:hypothetical protein
MGVAIAPTKGTLETNQMCNQSDSVWGRCADEERIKGTAGSKQHANKDCAIYMTRSQ